jgi:hypothetical protein
MKRVRYLFQDGESAYEKTLPLNEFNEGIAKEEAYNGEYEIYDDGQPEPDVEPTTDEILNAMLGVM